LLNEVNKKESTEKYQTDSVNSAVLNVTDASLVWRLWKCCSNKCCWVSEIITDIMNKKANKVNNEDV